MDANVEEREEEDDDEEGWSLRRRLEMTPPRLRDSCIKFLIFFRWSLTSAGVPEDDDLFF